MAPPLASSYDATMMPCMESMCTCPGLFTEPRRREIPRSWTSAKRSSKKFGDFNRFLSKTPTRGYALLHRVPTLRRRPAPTIVPVWIYPFRYKECEPDCRGGCEWATKRECADQRGICP
jgi:hypothetical protein